MLTFIRYIQEHFTFACLDCVRYNDDFVKSSFSSIPGILLSFWPGWWKSFFVPRASLYRGSLNRSSTVIKITKQLVRLFCGLYTKEQELALSRLVHGLLCRRVRVRFPNVTPNPSFNFFPFLVALSSLKRSTDESRTQLFEGRLALTQG